MCESLWALKEEQRRNETSGKTLPKRKKESCKLRGTKFFLENRKK